MPRRSRARGQPAKSRGRRAVALKRRNARKAKQARSPSASSAATKIAQLTRQRDEALEREAATAGILRLISSSPTVVQPVFNAIVRNFVLLCGSVFGAIYTLDGELVHLSGSYGFTPEQLDALRTKYPVRVDDRSVLSSRAILAKAPLHIENTRSDPEYDRGHAAAISIGRLLAVPLLRDGVSLGAIVGGWAKPGATPKQHEHLLQVFADQAVIAIENARLLSELRESLQQQTATADVLKVISRSTFDLKAVLDTLMESAARLCEADMGYLGRPTGDGLFRAEASYGFSSGLKDVVERTPWKAGRESAIGRVLLERAPIHIADAASDPEYRMSEMQKLGGYRAILGVPLMREGLLTGVLLLSRKSVRPFTDKQIELLTTFADQAVIAIENVRLFEAEQQRTRELSESLEQQTATAEVLRIISSSPGQLESVFQAMLENAIRICGAKHGHMLLKDDNLFHVAAAVNTPSELEEVFRHRGPFEPTRGSHLDRIIQTGRLSHTADDSAEIVQGLAAKYGGARSVVGVPMLKDDDLIGAIFIYRTEVRPFTDKQIELVQNFAAQAVIAIENARLLNELRRSLEQQTATADVLKAISRSTFDLQTVLDTLTKSAAQLCAADRGVILMQDGDVYRVRAFSGFSREAEQYVLENPLHPSRGNITGRVALEGKAVHIPDVLADPEYTAVDYQKAFGYRTTLGVPLLRDGMTIGVLTFNRDKVNPFTDKQIELAMTFADQAVIAIENARLLNELRQRTTDLTESLEQQTATSKVLEVISRSAFDLQAVFETVAESSVRLCAADRAFIYRLDGELLRMAVAFNAPQKLKDFISQNPIRLGRDSASGRAVLERRTIHIPDVLADPEYSYVRQDVEKIRTILSVPIIKGDDVLGVMGIYHLSEVRPFTDKQIALLETFADQAAIAIDNVRLLDELRQSLQQQTATADVLKIISRSTFDLQVVLNTLVESAARLCEAEMASINRQFGQVYRQIASYGFSREFEKFMEEQPIQIGRATTVARAIQEKKPIQIPDVFADPEFKFQEGAKIGGVRSVAAVPMLKDNELIGVIAVYRRDVRPFTEKQIELVQTFADQAVIAIENVRLFDEIQDKSRQLEEASQHKSQFLANMSHELRTPLNAILGYTELMADGAYGQPSEKMLGILKRLEANGRHLLGLINDVLDLSKIEAGQLVLELSDYSIQDIAQTVRSTLEPLATDKKLNFNVELAPQLPAGRGDGRRLTQVLINLVGNAIKFTDAGEVAIKAEANNGSFHVAVHDTGPGISASDQAKLFQEFQQADNAITKKKGGTGLGLAISKRIIEMHGGRIWVESQPGQGSTFAFTLPVIVERQVAAV